MVMMRKADPHPNTRPAGALATTRFPVDTQLGKRAGPNGEVKPKSVLTEIDAHRAAIGHGWTGAGWPRGSGKPSDGRPDNGPSPALSPAARRLHANGVEAASAKACFT